MMYDNHDEETIIAQCTPQGAGAIALLRLSGKNALNVADKMSLLPLHKKLSSQQTHTIHYGHVVDQQNNCIDQVLFFVMHAPNTFTGDTTVEITCHNNSFIVNNIISAAINAGARIAQNGEFTRRSVLNNKIDMLQAEAINDLIHANTQLTLKQSLSQLQGSFSSWITSIEKQLLKALAFSEASFEFLDEENMEFENDIRAIISSILSHITLLKQTFNQQQQIRQGIRIAIIGSVNAGKSSFFNALLNQERAIVTNIAGTTRDAIEAGVYKNGNYWTLIDTAGLRVTHDIIEQIGITRSHEEAQKADIILLVFDGAQKLTLYEEAIYKELYETYTKKIILIKNKIDLPEQPTLFFTNIHNVISVSSNTRYNIATVETVIQEKITQLFETIDSPFLLNQRHFNLLISLEQELQQMNNMLSDATSYELVSYHLQKTLATLAELTGKTISEAGMDAVFREFCVGK